MMSYIVRWLFSTDYLISFGQEIFIEKFLSYMSRCLYTSKEYKWFCMDSPSITNQIISSTIKTSRLCKYFSSSKKVDIILKIVTNIFANLYKLDNLVLIDKSFGYFKMLDKCTIASPSSLHPFYIGDLYGEFVDSIIMDIDIIQHSPQQYFVSKIAISIETLEKSTHNTIRKI